MSAVLPLQARFGALEPVARAAAALAALAGAICWCWLAALGAQPGAGATLLCTAPLLVTVALAFTSQADRHQYVARLLAAAAMLPVLLMMWTVSQDVQAPRWAEAVSAFGFMLLHLAGFALVIWHMASITTRIEPEVVTRPVSAELLSTRLQALMQVLGADGAPWQLSRGEVAGEWRIDSHHALPQGTDSEGRVAEPRFHRVLLNLQPGRHEVQVRERLAADGAAPKDADEASLRGPGDAYTDATRPQAQRVWLRTWQTTLVRPERLAAVRLQLLSSHAQAEGAAAEDAEGLVTVLAALVTRSGWAWQPVMRLRRD